MPDDDTDPVQQEFTWETHSDDAPAASAAPGPTASPIQSDWSQYLEEPQMPDAGAASTAYSAPASSSSAGRLGTSTSHSGLNDSALKKSGDLFAQADAKAAADIAPYQAQHDAQVASEREHSGAEQNAVADEALYTKGFETLNRKLYERQQDFYDHSAALEQQIQQQGQAVKAQYIGEYREQLAGVRQLIAQSGNPLDSLSRPEALGLGAAQFAQGFLAAKGINIDVSGQVDRWVDRSIKEHQMLIENARGAANDTLSLYNIARQASQDDYEARQRYRGFVIEGLKTAVQANAARFNSGVADARANQAIAKLQLDQDATERTMGDTLYGKYIQTRQMEKDEAYRQGQLALEKDKNSIEWYKAATERQAKAAKAAKGTGRLLIKDPEQKYLGPDGKMVNAIPLDPKTNKPAEGYKAVNEARWEVDPNATDAVKAEQVKKVNEYRNDWADYQDKMSRALELRKKAHDELEAMKGGALSSVGDFLGVTNNAMRRRMSPAYDEYRAAVDDMQQAQLKVETGGSRTQTEIDDMRARYPDEKILANHDGAQIFLNNREAARKKFERRMEDTGIIKVDANDPDRYELADTASPGLAQDYKNSREGGAPMTSTVQGIGAKAAEGSDKADNLPLSESWKGFEGVLSTDNKGRQFSDEEPEYARHMEHLAMIAHAQDPAEVHRLLQTFGSTDEDPATAQSDALEALHRMAGDKSLPSDRRKYAQYVLNPASLNPRVRFE